MFKNDIAALTIVFFLSFSTQLLSKLFQICDIQLASEGVNVAQLQIMPGASTQTPLKVDGGSLMFTLRPNLLGFGRNKLAPYFDETSRQELLAVPLPSIYPISRLLSAFETNVYRYEHKFRQYLLRYSGILTNIFNFSCFVLRSSSRRTNAV